MCTLLISTKIDESIVTLAALRAETGYFVEIILTDRQSLLLYHVEIGIELGKDNTCKRVGIDECIIAFFVFIPSDVIQPAR